MREKFTICLIIGQKHKKSQARNQFVPGTLLMGCGHRCADRLVSEYQSVAEGIHDDRLFANNLICQNLLRQVVEQILLDGSLHRTGTIVGVVTLLSQPVDGLRRDVEGEALRLEHLLHAGELQLDDVGNLLF